MYLHFLNTVTSRAGGDGDNE
eukprot:SAG11_NODE_18326_length_494_cov_0.941772_1_plen_20_part_10